MFPEISQATNQGTSILVRVSPLGGIAHLQSALCTGTSASRRILRGSGPKQSNTYRNYECITSCSGWLSLRAGRVGPW